MIVDFVTLFLLSFSSANAHSVALAQAHAQTHGNAQVSFGSDCAVAEPPSVTPPTEEVLDARVVSEGSSDWRGLSGYIVQFTIRDVNTGRTRAASITRTTQEFETLDTEARKKFGHVMPSTGLPSPPSVEGLETYIKSLVSVDTLRTSQLFDDFAAINYWECSKLKWFRTMFDLPSIFMVRLPTFWPVPPQIERERVHLENETAFECWLYVMSWHSHQNRSFFQPVINSYTKLMPDFDSGFPEDNHDVWALGVTKPVNYPAHWFKTPVHFLPGGFSNSRNVRLSFLGKNKFTFLEEENLRVWLKTLAPVYGSPTRILDVGTGQCFSAFAFEEAYPDAEIVGVDLAAGQIRFCRQWGAYRKSKVSFYHANGEELPFESESFDVVQYTYILHEMPHMNAFRILTEMHRVLKPGGVLSGFEVPYFSFGPEQKFLTHIFTWDGDWNSSSQKQGPEPYFGEYMEFNLYEQLGNAGFQQQTVHCSTIFDAVITATKATGPVKNECPLPPPSADFKLANLEGTWYEIGKLQTSMGSFFEGDCGCTKLVYTQSSDGGASVQNSCRKHHGQDKSPTVTTSQLVSTARGAGAFKEVFSFGPIKNMVDYTFVAIDIDGQQFAVEFDCTKLLGYLQYCFHIMSRNQTLDDTTVSKLMDLVQKFQLNPYKIEYAATKQEGCWTSEIVI